MTDKNGNAGREFVTCDSLPEPGKVRYAFPLSQFRLIAVNFGFSSDLGFVLQDLLPCDHFEWLDKYIKRLEIVAGVATVDGTSLGQNSSSAAEQLGAIVVGGEAVQNGNSEGVAEVKEELKKMNKKLKNLVKLKKQSNLMAAIFYFSAIALGVVYWLIISH